MGVLLVASKSDMASMTLYDAIMRLDGWSEPFSTTSGDYYIHECDSVYPVSYTHQTLPTKRIV